MGGIVSTMQQAVMCFLLTTKDLFMLFTFITSNKMVSISRHKNIHKFLPNYWLIEYVFFFFINWLPVKAFEGKDVNIIKEKKSVSIKFKIPWREKNRFNYIFKENWVIFL